MSKPRHIAAGKPASRSRKALWIILGAALCLALAVTAYVLTSEASGPPGPAPDGMVWVPGGKFQMGDDFPEFDDTQPIHEVQVDGFWMDRTEVTNAQFAEFVKATGYVTVAERQPDSKDFPDLTPEEAARLKPFSVVFQMPDGPVPKDDHRRWWKPVEGACWRQPEGPGSGIEGRMDHPVVHVAHADALACAEWAGKRLPTEAEWEYAARGGLDRKPYCWGDEEKPDGQCMANYWQGRFPFENTAEDGQLGTAPVASYPPNGYGLYDMAGNVWEWCADWYQPDYYRVSPKRNPQGPTEGAPPRDAPHTGLASRVKRGGSFLCSNDYCARYRPGGRMFTEPNSTANHTGFRCVKNR